MTTKIHPIAAPWGRFHLYSFLIDAPELAIVDAGVTESVASVPRALEAFGRRIEDVRWILLTHGHIDHVGGAFALWEATGRRAQVVIGDRDARFLRSRRAHVDEFLELRGEHFPEPEAEERKAADAEEAISGEMEPTLLVRGGETLDLGGVSVSVHAVPGHTPGAVAYVVDGQRDVFVGDSVQCLGAASGFPGYEDAEGYRKSLEYLRDVVKPRHLYLGHPYRRADGTPFPIELDEADASEAIQGSLDNEARIRAAVERYLAGGLVATDSPYSPFEAVATELGYTGDPTLEPAPFFTTMHAYRTTFPPQSGRTKGARHG